MFTPVGKAKALEVAREEIERRGDPFLPEIEVHSNLLWYTVITRAQTIGGSVYVRVGKRTGKIVSYWYILR